jgi:hypothetical protein
LDYLAGGPQMLVESGILVVILAPKILFSHSFLKMVYQVHPWVEKVREEVVFSPNISFPKAAHQCTHGLGFTVKTKLLPSELYWAGLVTKLPFEIDPQ